MYKIIGGDRKEYGPVSAEDLRRWIAEGRLNAQSSIQSEGSAEWKPLSTFPEFADLLEAQVGQAPPAGASPPPINPALWSAEILARQPQLDVGGCLSRSWNLLQANFGLLFGATLLVWLFGLLGIAGQFLVPIAGVLPALALGSITGLVYWILHGVFLGGLSLVFLNRIRGQPATVGGAFQGFHGGFAQLLLAGVVSSLLSTIGVCFCLVPGIYLLVAWRFSVPLVADKGLEFWSAMELSRKVVTRVWFPVLGMMLVAFLPFILTYIFAELKMITLHPSTMRGGPPDFAQIFDSLGQTMTASLPYVLLIKFVLLLNLPFGLGALMYAYEDLFGPRPAPGA
jgi:hypothetical protein